jgi:hypothetical protein
MLDRRAQAVADGNPERYPEFVEQGLVRFETGLLARGRAHERK